MNTKRPPRLERSSAKVGDVSADRKILILLVDDHRMIRESLRLLIDFQPDMKVIAEAGDGREAIEKARQTRPLVVVMDLSMPEVNGFEAIAAIRHELPSTKIVALTMYDDETCLTEACRAGVSGFVLKRSAADVLLQAIRSVIRGEVHFDPQLAVKTLVANRIQPHGSARERLLELSPRERQVLTALAWGRTNKEIASELSVSVKTIETYRLRIGDKLGLRTRTQMVQHAILQGWLHPGTLYPIPAPIS